MPIFQSYYLNGPTLATSTAVFLDPNMTVCAPDGFYYDGTIYREQVNCVLAEPYECGDCGLLCQETLEGISGGEGVYILNINLGSATGAVILTFSPSLVPDGIKAIYNGVTYNALSSPLDGYHAAPPNLPTYVGELASDCGLVANSPYVLTEYENSGNTFVATGNTPTVVVLPTQVSLSAADPQGCVMVIPKPNIGPPSLSVVMYGACPASSYDVTVNCPERLQEFYSTGDVSEVPEPCEALTNQIYYSAPVNGNGITLGLYDWVFDDYNGQTILPNGEYIAPIHVPAPFDTFEVTDGVVTNFLTTCAPVTLDYEVRNDTSSCVSGGITSANLLVEWMPLATTIVNVNADTIGSTSIQMGIYRITFTVSYSNPFTGCGGIDMRLKLNTVEVASAPFITPVSGGVYQLSYIFTAIGTTNYDIEATVSNGIPL